MFRRSSKSAKEPKAAKAPKPAKAAKAPKPAKGAKGGVYVQKPRSDIYTALLVISLLATLIGRVLLYLERREYSQASFERPRLAYRSVEMSPGDFFRLTGRS